EAVELEHEAGAVPVLRDRRERGGRRLDLRDEVPGQVPRGRARVRDRLPALVERLRGLERAAGGEPEAPVRVALQRGQVVEKRRTLGLLLPLDRLDRPVLAGDLLDDLVGARAFLEPRLVALEPEALVPGIELRPDE